MKFKDVPQAIVIALLDDPLLSWLHLLTQGFGNAEEAEEIMCIYPDLRKFAEMYGKAIDDPEVLRAYENEAAAYRNYHTRKDYFERIERETAERVEREAAERMDGFTARLRELGVSEALIDKAMES